MNARSYSDINTYQRCAKRAYYRTVLNIQRKARSSNLWRGINAHETLKVFFLVLQSGGTKEEGLAAVRAEADRLLQEAKSYTFEDELLDVETEMKMILYVVEEYVDRYVGDSWDILHVEETFLIKLDSGEVISFTPDLVVRDRNGFVWIVDHKTTSAVPDGKLPFGDTQALLYYTGVKSLYPETKGFIFNRLRKKIPTQPRLTKTGKTRVADLNRIDTTFEVLRDFLRETAPGLLSEPSHQRRMAELRDGPDRFFWTETVYVNEATEAAILEDVAAVVQHINLSVQTGLWPRSLREDRGYMSCSRCPYQPLCSAEMYGFDTEVILRDQYEPADPKNPYEGEYEDV